MPADADEDVRQDLAERMAPFARTIHAGHPDLAESHVDAPGGRRHAERTVATAMVDLYNAAQIDVLVRIDALITASSR